MFLVRSSPTSIVASSRTPTGGGSSTIRPGSGVALFSATKIGPLTGRGCSGESIVAVPTLELAGHAPVAAWAAGHRIPSTAWFAANNGGIVTVALLSAASSGLKRSVLVIGGLSERLREPGRPDRARGPSG